MKRAIQGLVITAIVILALTFGALNDTPIFIDFFFFATTWPLAFSLLLFFFVGMTLSGVLVFLSMWRHHRRRLREVSKQHVDVSHNAKPSPALLARDE